MSIQEPSDESEWITFVSPLVRIVEQTEGSTSSPSHSQSFREGSASASNSSNDLKGKRPMASQSVVYDMPTHMHGGPHGVEVPPEAEVWSFDDRGIQTDLFNSLMDFGDSKYES